MKIDILKKILQSKRIENDNNDKNNWDMAEVQLQTELPSDYKEFINEYGTGSINNFLWILTPFDEDEYMNLFIRGQEIIKAYTESKINEPEYFEHNVFPIKGGILPWGYTDNGDELYWLTEGNCDEWKIVVYESRSSDFYEYNMGIVQFIYELISKKIICPAFPDDFPGDICEFINC